MSILYHSVPWAEAHPPDPADPPLALPAGLAVEWASMDHRWIPTDRRGHCFRVPYAAGAGGSGKGEILGYSTRSEAAAFCRAWATRRGRLQLDLWGDNTISEEMPTGVWLENGADEREEEGQPVATTNDTHDDEKARDAIATIAQSFQKGAQAYVAAFAPLLDAIQSHIQEMAPKILAALTALLDVLRERYAAVGAPYGAGDEVMFAFYRDLMAAERAREHTHQEQLRVWMRADNERLFRGEPVPVPVPPRPPLRDFLPERLRVVVREHGADDDGTAVCLMCGAPLPADAQVCPCPVCGE